MNSDFQNQAFNKTSIIKGFIWKLSERCGVQIVSFVVTIILARMLTPHDYGVVAIITVFINILNVFIDSGLGNALIQKKDVDNLDFSSVFYFNLLICLLVYGVLYLSADWIAEFYAIDSLTDYIRGLGIILIISGVRNVQQAYISRNMVFKKFFYANMSATIVSGGLGIIVAYMGLGVWALIIQQISSNFLGTLILWFVTKWRPNFVFSISRLKAMLNYGWKLLASALLDTGYMNLREIIIGKIYSPADLAFYTQGAKFPTVIVNNIDASINSVLVSAMSREQNNKERLRNILRKSIKLSSFLIWPLMALLVVVSESLVCVILTDKWLPVVPYIMVFCIAYAIYPMHTCNLSAIVSMGRTDLFLRLEVYKKILGIIVLLPTVTLGPLAMAWGLVVAGLISTFINSYPNQKLLGYEYYKQVKDVLPSMSLAIVTGVIIFPLNMVIINKEIALMFISLVYMIVYFLLARLLRLEELSYIIDAFRNIKSI